MPKASNFTPGGVQNRDTKNRTLGTIVTSIQDFKPREKQISQLFSYCELINLLRNGTIVRCLRKLENVGEICFSRGLESWIDVTIVSSLLFLVSRFCTPPEVKFDAFGTSKHGEGKSLSKIFFATLISTLGRFNRANKKKSVVYTLRLSWLNSYTKLMQTSPPLHFVEFDSSRALEIHDVARAVSCIACALEMRSSNGREHPKQSYSCVVYLDKEA